MSNATLEIRVTSLERWRDLQFEMHASTERKLTELNANVETNNSLIKALQVTQSEHTASLRGHGETLRAHTMRLDRIDGRLDGIDGRLNGIDGRLDGIDGRLNGIDGRLDGIDGRLNGIDGRLDKLDGRLDKLETGMAQGFNEIKALLGAAGGGA